MEFPIPPGSDTGIRCEHHGHLVGTGFAKRALLILSKQCMRIGYVRTQVRVDGIHDFSHIDMYPELLIGTVSHVPSADGLSTRKVVTANQVRFILGIDDIQPAPKGIERITVVQVQGSLCLLVRAQLVDTALQQVPVLIIIGIVQVLVRRRRTLEATRCHELPKMVDSFYCVLYN